MAQHHQRVPGHMSTRQFRYRKGGITPEGWSGHGTGRRGYIVDVEYPNGAWRMLCIIEGLSGDWRIHGVGDPDPERPKRKFMGPFRTREEAAQAYFDEFACF